VVGIATAVQSGRLEPVSATRHGVSHVVAACTRTRS
jgi:hypothetical protein